METTSTLLHASISLQNYSHSSNVLSLSKDQSLYNSQEFCLSQNSTDACSDDNGCVENDVSDHSSWTRLIEDDMPIRKVRSALDEDLQSLMEAEEELQSIWRPQAKKLKVRTLGCSPVQQKRHRYSDV